MKSLILKISAVIAYVGTLVVNYLSNALPINGRTPGQISDSLPNLFAPPGFTFSIWGVIYLSLGGYVAYLFSKRARKIEDLLEKTNVLFIATSVANVSWIFAWHYGYFGTSLCVMVALFVLLVMLTNPIREARLASWDKWLVRIPFGIYFGWISVAMIANLAAYLVSVGWSGFGISDSVWTAAMLVVGTLLGVSRMLHNRDAAYGAVFVWAYFGILFKHLSATGFDGRYPLVVATAAVSLFVLVFSVSNVAVKSE